MATELLPTPLLAQRRRGPADLTPPETQDDLEHQSAPTLNSESSAAGLEDARSHIMRRIPPAPGAAAIAAFPTILRKHELGHLQGPIHKIRSPAAEQIQARGRFRRRDLHHLRGSSPSCRHRIPTQRRGICCSRRYSRRMNSTTGRSRPGTRRGDCCRSRSDRRRSRLSEPRHRCHSMTTTTRAPRRRILRGLRLQRAPGTR